MTTSTLDGSLVGFGSTVAEKSLVGTRVFAQPVGKSRLFGNVIQVTDVMDRRHLVGNGLGQGIVVVSKSTGGDSTDTI